MALFQKTANIKVGENQDYNISIAVGDGQKGASAFNKPNGSNVHGTNITNEPIGSASALNGKVILIDSLISDVNPHTNNTTLTIHINNEEVVRYEEQTERPNGTNWFETTLNFHE